MVLLKRWRTFRQLPPSDRWTLVQALVLLPLAAATLRMLSFARVQALLTATLPKTVSPSSATDRMQVTARLVQLAAHRSPLRITCLPHSLVLWWILRRRGGDAVLRFGVRKATGEIEAHAWVEHGGVALNDDADVHERFAAFDRAIAR